MEILYTFTAKLVLANSLPALIFRLPAHLQMPINKGFEVHLCRSAGKKLFCIIELFEFTPSRQLD